MLGTRRTLFFTYLVLLICNLGGSRSFQKRACAQSSEKMLVAIACVCVWVWMAAWGKALHVCLSGRTAWKKLTVHDSL